MGRNFFTPNGAVDIRSGLEVWRGHHQSVRPAWKRVLLNIDVSASAFHKDISVLDYLKEVMDHDCTEKLLGRKREKFAKEMKGIYCIKMFCEGPWLIIRVKKSEIEKIALIVWKSFDATSWSWVFSFYNQWQRFWQKVFELGSTGKLSYMLLGKSEFFEEKFNFRNGTAETYLGSSQVLSFLFTRMVNGI